MYNPYDNQQNGPPSFPSMPSYNPDAVPFRAPSPYGNPGLQHPSHPSYDGRPVEVGFDLAPSGYPSQLTPSYTAGYSASPQPQPPFTHSYSPQHSHSGPSPQPSRGGHSPRPSYSGLPGQSPYAELQASYSGPILQPPYANHSPHSSHGGVASQYQYAKQPFPSHQPGHSPLSSYVGYNPQSSYSSAYGHQTLLDSHGNTPAQVPARAVQFVFQQPKGWDRAGKVVDDKGRVAYILKNVEKKSWTDSFRDGPNNPLWVLRPDNSKIGLINWKDSYEDARLEECAIWDVGPKGKLKFWRGVLTESCKFTLPRSGMSYEWDNEQEPNAPYWNILDDQQVIESNGFDVKRKSIARYTPHSEQFDGKLDILPEALAVPDLLDAAVITAYFIEYLSLATGVSVGPQAAQGVYTED